MKYIRSYKNHRNLKDGEINEGFLGNLFKRVKSKMAIELSKQLGGSAKKVESLMDKYKQNLTGLLDEKNKKLLAIVELERAKKEGGEVEEELQKAIDANKESDSVYSEKKKLMKEKFDLEFQKIIKDEDNDNIKHYIKIKKIELGEDMLTYEMEYIDQKMGISKEDIESSEMLSNLLNGKKEQMKKLQGMKAQIEKEGFGNKEGEEESQEEREFKPGDEVVYFKSDDEEKKEPKEAKVADKQEDGNGEKVIDGSLRVTTETAPNGFVIKKTQIKPEEKEEVEEEEKKDETSEDENL